MMKMSNSSSDCIRMIVKKKKKKDNIIIVLLFLLWKPLCTSSTHISSITSTTSSSHDGENKEFTEVPLPLPVPVPVESNDEYENEYHLFLQNNDDDIAHKCSNTNTTQDHYSNFLIMSLLRRGNIMIKNNDKQDGSIDDMSTTNGIIGNGRYESLICWLYNLKLNIPDEHFSNGIFSVVSTEGTHGTCSYNYYEFQQNE